MKIGDYVRTRTGTIGKIININEFREPSMKYGIDFQCADIIFKGDENIAKSSPDILDLLKPMDLLYIDIDNDYAGGIIVPRIAETQNELNLMIDLIKSGKWILKGVVTSEQLDSIKYKVGDYMNDEVEIIEEKKLPKKLEEIGKIDYNLGYIDYKDIEVLKTWLNSDMQSIFNELDLIVKNQNQLIDYLESKEKGE